MKPISSTTVQVTGESLIATGIRNFGVVDETCKKRVTPEEFLAWINARTSGEEIRDRKSSPDFEIRIRDLGALVYLSATEDTLYAAGSITDLVKHGISAPVLDTDAILMLLEAGFVLPPLTPLRGVYRVWPFSVARRRRCTWASTAKQTECVSPLWNCGDRLVACLTERFSHAVCETS